MNLSPNDRIAGVLVPLFAIRTENDLGVGDLEGLRQLVDWVRELGFKLVQLLPMNETGGDHSPYNAISSRAIDPATLYLAPGSPPDLSRRDFQTITRKIDLSALRRGSVKYAAVKSLKKQLLERAFRGFQKRTRNSPDDSFALFCAAEERWLEDYALFRALMEKNGEREKWDEWPNEYRTISAARRWSESLRNDERRKFEERRKFFSYVQWIAHEQWRGLKAYAEKRGVALMGDIPFGVSYYSADVFAQPEQFALDWSGGAPPEPYFKDDKFTQKWGQNWGIPLYRWDVMRSRNFGWWRRRVRGVREIFHVFRIDHVLGFYRIYAFPWRPERNQEFLPLSREEMRAKTGGPEPHFVPRDDSTPEHCAANCREGEEHLRIVLEAAGSTHVAGEDLGTVPDYVRPNLRSLGIAGFKIPQWENYPDGRSIPGRAYERLSITTFATHDHKPLRALWEEAIGKAADAAAELARHDFSKIAEFSGIAPLHAGMDYMSEIYPRIFEALLRCESWIAIVMITDLLGRRERFNVPGTAARTNWTRRLHTTVSKLGKSRALQRQLRIMRELIENSGRVVPSENEGSQDKP